MLQTVFNKLCLLAHLWEDERVEVASQSWWERGRQSGSIKLWVNRATQYMRGGQEVLAWGQDFEFDTV